MSVQDILEGNRRALARFLTKVENNRDAVQLELSELFPHSANSHIIGLTGAPGTGKSSLVTSLTKQLRKQNKTVAIVAVDPTSPFSGGAILGDRIRMRDLSGDKGVYIRSMATRGNLGGIALATQDVVRVLAAAGYDVTIVETVGAGQSEIDIVRLAQTTIVVEAPGLGDGLQAIKAGILETADILVVNKSDLAGADKTARALKTMLEIGHPTKRTTLGDDLWIPSVIKTSSTEQQGFEELLDAIDDHREYLNESETHNIYFQDKIRMELTQRLQATLYERFIQTLEEETIADMINRVAQYQIHPQQAVDVLLKKMEFFKE